MLLRSLFRNLSLFTPCCLYRSIPFLRPFVCSRSIPPIHFFRSILSVSSPLHFPPCLDFLFPSPLSSSQFLAPLSAILPLKSPPKSIQSSLFSFIASSTRLLVILISLLYIVIILHYITFFCPCIFSLLWSLFFNLQFHPSYYYPGSSCLFLFSFCPLTFPFVLFRWRLSPLCFFSSFRFLCPSTFLFIFSL
jgi:hypothetical protein